MSVQQWKSERIKEMVYRKMKIKWNILTRWNISNMWTSSLIHSLEKRHIAVYRTEGHLFWRYKWAVFPQFGAVSISADKYVVYFFCSFPTQIKFLHTLYTVTKPAILSAPYIELWAQILICRIGGTPISSHTQHDNALLFIVKLFIVCSTLFSV